ncbi:MAG: hypothetical protein WB822_14645, partial [Rhodoplanes sp.]
IKRRGRRPQLGPGKRDTHPRMEAAAQTAPAYRALSHPIFGGGGALYCGYLSYISFIARTGRFLLIFQIHIFNGE